MDNMHWDELAQSFRGTAVPYELPDQPGTANSNVYFGHNKPLRGSSEWLQDYFGVGPDGSDWQILSPSAAMGLFSTSPFSWPVEKHQGGPLQECAVQQLIQAMAGFTVPGAGLTEPVKPPMFNPASQIAIDGSRFA